MPGQTMKSSLAAVLGERMRKVHEEHKADPVRTRRSDPPEGISNGTAQLVSATWGKHTDGDNKGKAFVRFQSVIRQPAEVNGQVCEGIQLFKDFPMYNTTWPANALAKIEGTAENHYLEMLNQLEYSFGVNKAEVDFDSLEEVLKGVTEAKPCHRFSTRGYDSKKGAGGKPLKPGEKPARRVGVDWLGVCEFSENGQAGDHVVDETGGATEAGGDTSEPGEPADAGEGTPDLDHSTTPVEELVEIAKGGGEDGTPESEAAGNRLIEIAVEAGIDEADARATDTWDDLAAMIEAAGQGETNEGQEPEPEKEPEEPWKPTKGLVVKWRESDPKTGKPKTDPKTKKPVKAIDVEVVVVYPKGELVTLKNSTTGKAVTGADKLPRKVRWSELIHD